jgi:peptidoglycan/xylan/chitin deacetylase (PgdA/CDA1 family)
MQRKRAFVAGIGFFVLMSACAPALAAGTVAAPRVTVEPEAPATLAHPETEATAAAATPSPWPTQLPTRQVGVDTPPITVMPPTTSTPEASVGEVTPTAPTPAARRLPILEYHYSTFRMSAGVMMTSEWFDEQLRWLAENGFTTVTSAELAAFVAGDQALPARSVALTFDVGASHFDDYSAVVIPTLRRHQFRAIFFVMPSQTRDTCDGRLTCWPDLLAWRDEGLISIESHSLFHYDFATLPPETIALDIARSRLAIEAKTGQPVVGLCYPFDSVNPAAFDLLAAAGYRFAVAGATRNDRSAQFGDAQPYSLPRYYPYSGEAFYPIISGTGGRTFAEMMLAATSDVEQPAH